MAANNTTYTITLDDAVHGEPIKNRQTAINLANKLVSSKEGFVAVVTTSAGKDVHRVARRKITKVTKPGTLKINVPKVVQAVVGKGFVAAYERPENGTVVFRNERKDVTKETKYAVVHAATLVLAGYAPTTRAAGQLQKEFAPKRLAASLQNA